MLVVPLNPAAEYQIMDDVVLSVAILYTPMAPHIVIVPIQSHAAVFWLLALLNSA